MDMMFVALIPLVLFVLVDLKWGMRAGIVTACVMAVALIAYTWFRTGTIDQFLVGETVLIVVMGLVSLRLNESKFFKMQPVAVGVIFSSVILWYQFFDEPLLIKMLPTMYAMMPQLKEFYSSDHALQVLDRLSLVMAITLLVHAALVAWVALKKGNVAWIMARLAIYPMILIAAILSPLL